jgi:hypothetical protein
MREAGRLVGEGAITIVQIKAGDGGSSGKG